MTELLLKRGRSNLDAYVGGVQDLLSDRFGTRLAGLNGMLLRLTQRSDPCTKLAVILFVVNKDEALRSYMRERAGDPRKWDNFQAALERETEAFLDGTSRFVEYVQRCTDAYIIA